MVHESNANRGFSDIGTIKIDFKCSDPENASVVSSIEQYSIDNLFNFVHGL